MITKTIGGFREGLGGVPASYLVGQRAQVHAHKLGGAELGGFEAPDDVLEGGGHHKVLLLQTQLLALKELETVKKSQGRCSV